MPDIKPIETAYNGYRFRSRLEARWAVFFDAAGIEYQYEPEGFELSDGTKYLPDFYLPKVHVLGKENTGLWVDVKSGKENDEYCKVKQFANDGIGKIAILFPFTFMQNCSLVLPGNENGIQSGCAFCKCNHCGEVSFTYYGSDEFHAKDCDTEYRELCKKADEIANYILHDYKIDTRYISMDEVEYLVSLLHKFKSKFYHKHKDFLDDAVEKAKQARFEFGECGL